MIYEGNCRLGDLFTSRREKGRPGLPTLSVTLNDGLVNREDMERKQDTSLAPEEHLLVKPGDIAYNMMRMWQGAFGLADREGLVSPAYVVLNPRRDVDPLYASYLFETRRLIYLFWAYSHGLTEDRLRLYFDDFRRIPVFIPPFQKQTAYVGAIKTWESAISLSKRLLELTTASRKSLVNDLASGNRRIDSFRDPWDECRLGEICDFSRGYTYESESYADSMTKNAFLTLRSVEKGGGFNSEGIKFLVSGVDKRFVVKPGDLLCAITDIAREAPVVGAPLLVPEDLSSYDQVSFSMDLVKLKVSPKIRKAFLYFFLQTPEVRRRARSLANGSTVLHLDVHGYKKVKVRFPKQLDEQDQIVRSLLLAEEMEKSIKGLIAAFTRGRQGLLQQLIKTHGA